MELLVFRIDAERYGVALGSVHRVLAAVQVTPVPGAPPVVAGVVDVHGTLTPVFDLRRRFGRPAREVSEDDHFILARAGERPVLLHVDEVSDIARVDDSDVRDAGTVVQGEAISGIARLSDGLVLIHDLAAFLSEAESLQLEDALAGNRPGAEPT